MRVTLAGLSSQYIHVTLAPWCLRHAARKAGVEPETLCEQCRRRSMTDVLAAAYGD